jgi:Ca2+-dependent lipid-binding protein
MSILNVKLLKVTNLADKDLIGKSDPYVKFHLEQDNVVFDKDFGTKKSTTKKGQLNPVYNETFAWEMPSKMGLKNVVLRCTIKDDDPLFDDKLGFCKIKLETLDLHTTPTCIDRVIDNNVFTSDSRIFLELSYHP